MKKVSLNTKHEQYDLFKTGLYFVSSDGIIIAKGRKLHFVGEGKPAYSNDVSSTVTCDNRFVVEDVEDKKIKRSD